MNKTDYSSLFNDKRLSVRGEDLLRSLYKSSSNSIQSLSKTRAEQKAYYRFLHNNKVTEQSLAKEIALRCSKAAENKIVLCIQDTTEINLAKHAGRLKSNSGLGPIDAVKKGVGFKIHPCLVVDAATCFPYGYAGIEVFNRSGLQKMHYHRLRKLPVEQKESGRWLRGNDNVRQHLSKARSVIIIQDREGDIYEQFTPESLASNAHLLVRCKFNRYLEDNSRLWNVIDNQPALGTYKLLIAEDSHKQTAGREAVMEVRFAKVKFRRPEKKVKGVAPLSKEVYVVEAKEITAYVSDPVHWRLITTCCIENIQSAVQVIEWYSCRWMIEEVFRVLKKECYDIEGSELESGWAIRKLSVMMLDTIIKLFQMLIAYNTEEGEILNSTIAFEQEEIECLEKINKKLQGSTTKLSNPYNTTKLKGAVWVIARLGGWKGYASQRKPGATTLIKGLEKFYNYYEGFSLEKDVGTR